VNFKIVF